jgi:hypothetical protein
LSASVNPLAVAALISGDGDMANISTEALLKFTARSPTLKAVIYSMAVRGLRVNLRQIIIHQYTEGCPFDVIVLTAAQCPQERE